MGILYGRVRRFCSFEINDAGIPFWVVTTFKRNWFSGNRDAGIVLINANRPK
jgi:hypothetical protein